MHKTHRTRFDFHIDFGIVPHISAFFVLNVPNSCPLGNSFIFPFLDVRRKLD